MSESLAKLTIKVKLHPAVTVRPPEKARFSKAKIAVFGLALMLLGSLSWFLSRSFLGHSQATAEPAIAAAEIEEVMASESMPAAVQTEPPIIASVLTPAPADLAQAEPQPAATVQSSTVQLSTVQPTKAQPSHKAANLLEPAQQALPQGFRRIVLTQHMRQLEPGPAVQQIVAKAEIQRLYLFTELSGYAGQQVRHRWWFRDQLQTDTLLTIEDSPWRTYSEKWLLPDQTGPWRVEIIDQEQNVLYQHDFQYQ